MFDMYCRRCCLPFYTIKSGTKWLEKAEFEYGGYTIHLTSNKDGQFTIAKALPQELRSNQKVMTCIDGKQIDIMKLSNFNRYACAHPQCRNRQDISESVFEQIRDEYNGQEFDSEEFLEDTSLIWLLRDPSKELNPLTGRYVTKKVNKKSDAK